MNPDPGVSAYLKLKPPMMYLVTNIFHNTDRAKAQGSTVFTDAQLMNNVFHYMKLSENHTTSKQFSKSIPHSQTAHLPYTTVVSLGPFTFKFKSTVFTTA